MKKIMLCCLVLMTSLCSYAQNYLNAKESDPNVIGWMKGFPPAKDKILNASDGSFFNFPQIRYSVNHMREFFPTRKVNANKNWNYRVTKKIDNNIENITYVPWDSNESKTFLEGLDLNYTDGIIIMHKGKIIYEKYLAGYKEAELHSAMSVSKSFTGTLASILVAEGILDENKKVADYIPELKDSGFGDATIRQVMNMTTAIQYSEDYNNPKAEIWEFSESGNIYRPANYNGPQNFYEYLKTVKKLSNQNHGDAFGYRTVNTEVLGWIISRVTNKDLTELLSEKIWQPLGAYYDGFYQLDPAGIAYAGGGFSLNLQDMAYFGEMIRNNGKLQGKQIIPKQAVLDITTNTDLKEAQYVFAKSDYPKLKNWSYRNMWWRTNNKNGAFMARGVHGQAIYIDPKAEMVIARFASSPYSSNKYIDPTSLPLYEAIADYLLKK